jgi:predicted nucleic acid-binding Zn ribbon protein
MPVYVYRNLTTGATFEVEQRITEPALSADPTTGDPVKRIIQPVGIAFKGSGFYVNDSRGKRAASAPAKGADAKGADGTGADAPSAPKAETPPPAAAATPSTATTSGD